MAWSLRCGASFCLSDIRIRRSSLWDRGCMYEAISHDVSKFRGKFARLGEHIYDSLSIPCTTKFSTTKDVLMLPLLLK